MKERVPRFSPTESLRKLERRRERSRGNMAPERRAPAVPPARREVRARRARPLQRRIFCVFLFLRFFVSRFSGLCFGSRGREAQGGAQEIRERPCRDGGTKRSGTTGLTLVFCFTEGVFFGFWRPADFHGLPGLALSEEASGAPVLCRDRRHFTASVKIPDKRAGQGTGPYRGVQGLPPPAACWQQ